VAKANASTASPAASHAAPTQKPAAQKPEGRILASPLAKKLAKERNLDLTTIQGSGPNKRIMSRDLAQTTATPTAAPAALQAPKAPAVQLPRAVICEALSPMRQVIAKRLQESKSTIPHFYVRQEIDAQPISSLREELKRHDKNYTINDFIIKACAIALKHHPEINSGFDSQKFQAIRFPSVDISVAVTIQGGLITPIIFEAHKKSLSAISQEMKQLATRAREGKLTPNEYQGGSFTISNLGMYGISDMTAIINPPQGAILGIGAASDVPVVKNGQVVPGKVMSMTISCDHRLIDGAEAANFMRTLKQLLENPILFLSE
jgi:pyruvate dehydrogenase E2 component (dihydrolipoamide acetyltransferase)